MSIEELTKLSKSPTDVFTLVERDLSTLSSGIRELLGTDHPVLESCAKYFFELDGTSISNRNTSAINVFMNAFRRQENQTCHGFGDIICVKFTRK